MKPMCEMCKRPVCECGQLRRVGNPKTKQKTVISVCKECRANLCYGKFIEFETLQVKH